MTVIKPNSVAGINSITVQSGNSLAVHKANGELIRTLTSSSGVSTFSSISVGTAATDNSAGKSINIGVGASISQHADNSLSFGTGGDERARIDSSGKLAIGNLSPQQLLHVWPDTANTTSAYVRVTSGDRNSNTGIDLGSDADGDGRLNVISNGKLKFYTNDTERFRLTETGDINVSTAATIKANGNATFSGIVTATSFVGDGSGLTGAGPSLSGSTNNTVVTVTGANAIQGESSLTYDGNGIFNITGTGAAGVFVITPDTVDGGIYFNNGSSNKGALTYLHTDETMNFRVNGTNKMTINTDGDVIPGSNNSQDLGSSSLRWANVFTNDLNLSNKGSTNSVDGTWGSYTIQEGENDLFLINKRNGKKYKFNLTEVS